MRLVLGLYFGILTGLGLMAVPVIVVAEKVVDRASFDMIDVMLFVEDYVFPVSIPIPGS